MTPNFSTSNKSTCCPGCPNFLILESVKKALAELELKPEDIAITTGIGCHGKIFDYLNVNGINCLHGRSIPVATGIHLANPKLKIMDFVGDGDNYSEGMEHFIHAARFNPDITLIVHDNQSFSLTEGQATPVSEEGFKTKAEPIGELNHPFNPIKLALAAETSFIARCNAKDMQHTTEILKQAIKHKGFSFVEIIQDCLIFNKEMNGRDKLMYKIENNKDNMKQALELADEWNYNSKQGKIPIGIIYQKEKPTLAEKVQKIVKK